MTEQEIKDMQARLAYLETQNADLATAKADAETKVSTLAADKEAAEQKAAALASDNEAKDSALINIRLLAADDLRKAQAKADEMAAAKEAAEQKAADLASKLKQEIAKDAPLSFEIDEDNEELDVKKGDVFEFTAPTCTWDDNSIINFRELAESKEAKDQERYAFICASLVQRKSGLIRRKEA